MSHQISWKDNGFLIKISGKLASIGEIHDINGALAGDARFVNDTYQIWDFLEADGSELCERDAMEPAVFNLASVSYAPRLRVALVATEPHAVGLCQHYIAKAKEFGVPWTFEMFASMEAALTWVKA